MSEVLLTKKNKKGLEKTTDIKKSIGSYRFEEYNLLIYLKTSQGSKVSILRNRWLIGANCPECDI